MRLPPLETKRLLIRPFEMEDLDDAHRLFDVELRDADLGTEGAASLEERRRWLQWSALNVEQLEKQYQPPYGDRALVLKSTGGFIGACGFVPMLNSFEQLPSLHSGGAAPAIPAFNTPEVGLYWAVSPAHRRQGYATEAARALIGFAFGRLRLKRILATTTHDNLASQGVMRKLGMHLESNPHPEPPWLMVAGILENPALHAGKG